MTVNCGVAGGEDGAVDLTSDADLSRLMFEARESVEMWADVVESRMEVPDPYTRGLVARLDAYRAARGWSEHGFGGEDECATVPKTMTFTFEFWEVDDTASLQRLAEAIDALTAMNVIKSHWQLGKRMPTVGRSLIQHPMDARGHQGVELDSRWVCDEDCPHVECAPPGRPTDG